MANGRYLKGLRRLLEGRFDFRSSSSQVYRCLLVRTGSTAGTDLITPEFVGDITTLNEFDGANYARQTLSLTSPAVDVANNRVEVAIANAVFANLGPSSGVSQGIGCVVYEFITNDAASPLIAFFDEGGFPFVGSGTTFTVQFNAEGGIAERPGTL
jgi:hypothetical protein